MIQLVKLTDARGCTYNDTAWHIGQTISVPPDRRRRVLCSKGIIHAYRSLNLALLLNPAHSNYPPDGLVLAAETPKVVVEDLTKTGVWELTPTAWLRRPDWWQDTTIRKRVQVRFACLCARVVLPLFDARYPHNPHPSGEILEAETWLNPSTAILALPATTIAPVTHVTHVTSYAAADAATYAASAAREEAAAFAAALAADFAASASSRAARAARTSASAPPKLDLVTLADDAVRLESQ